MHKEDNTANSKKDIILDRLNKRNKERQNIIDFQQEHRMNDKTELEKTDNFSEKFTLLAHDIESLLHSIEDSNGAEDKFLKIYSSLQDLQKYLTTSTIFLSDFKIKACQSMLYELNKKCDETKLLSWL